MAAPPATAARPTPPKIQRAHSGVGGVYRVEQDWHTRSQVNATIVAGCTVLYSRPPHCGQAPLTGLGVASGLPRSNGCSALSGGMTPGGVCGRARPQAHAAV